MDQWWSISFSININITIISNILTNPGPPPHVDVQHLSGGVIICTGLLCILCLSFLAVLCSCRLYIKGFENCSCSFIATLVSGEKAQVGYFCSLWTGG